MIFKKNRGVLVLWGKVVSALEGLSRFTCPVAGGSRKGTVSLTLARGPLLRIPREQTS